MIKGIQEGEYKVSISPKEEYNEVEIQRILIKTGIVTELDTVFLRLN